jgi:SAM-dependent methyltransferase
MNAQEREVYECNICGTSVLGTVDLRFQKDDYDILRCSSCGTLFRAELPDPAELREIYGPAYFSDSAGATHGQGYADYLSEEENHRANAVPRLKLIERHQPPGRLLDVGCAAGFFMDEGRQRGWRVEGVELSPEMAGHASEALRLHVHALPFQELEVPPGELDAITMWDYIEHSTDPRGDLERSGELLRPGGVLAVSTGDAGSVVARLSGRRWHLLTPRHHNFFFTRGSLEQAFRTAGFDVLRVEYASSLYSVHYLAHKLQTLTNLRVIASLSRTLRSSRFGSRAVPVNLRDIVTVVGRRR